MTRSIRFLCAFGIHRYRWQFVGNAWNPDLYVQACTTCGRERESDG